MQLGSLIGQPLARRQKRVALRMALLPRFAQAAERLDRRDMLDWGRGGDKLGELFDDTQLVSCGTIR